MTSYHKGLEAEEKARLYLQTRGMTCRHQRFQTKGGEIDLVMDDKGTLVFVEVKRRRTTQEAIEAISLRQQKRIIMAALYYLDKHFPPPCMQPFIRFDVVLLSMNKIHHIKQAFDATDKIF